MILNGAQMVCECLLREGAKTIFGIPGGAVLPLYDTLPEYPDLRHILVRHEQGAAHAADGFARVTGRPGIAWATSGPGATNLVTGIATAQIDSVPMVVVTGQVARAVIGTDAFQETDITGITLPITKQNYLIMHASDIPRAMKEAFHIATTGRPGVVLIDIPKDVFMEEADFEYPDTVDLPGYKPNLEGHPAQIKRAARMIQEAQRPIILAGHGIVLSSSYDELRELAEKAQCPVVTTLLGVSCFPENHFLSVGMAGMHGRAYASYAIEESDLIIALGMRFDDRVTGKVSAFAQKAKKIHIDVDPTEIGKNVKVDVPIVGDMKRVLVELNKRITPTNHLEWIERIEQLKRLHPVVQIKDDRLQPQHIMQTLSDVTEGKAIVVTGVGQHQMWAAQYYCFTEPRTLITSGGVGTMGYEVPGAMGAKVGRPDKLVWSICGDGGFQMTMSDLATMVENKISVKFAIINNSVLGMVRQHQGILYGRNYVASTFTHNPDFVKLADAFGMLGLRVTDKSQVRSAMIKAMEYDGPALIDFRIEQDENVYPFIPPSTTVHEMIEVPQTQEVGT